MNAPSRRTRQEAIEAHCKECIFDPSSDGTWRMQVEACNSTNCNLWPYRARSRSKHPDSAPVQLQNETKNNKPIIDKETIRGGAVWQT